MTRRISILDDEDDDPVLSAINLVDVFLVAMAILMIAVMQDPVRKMLHEDVTVIRDAGKPTMEILVKDGQKLTRFHSTGASAEGNGTKAGTAYELSDGTLVYVPSTGATK
jgi:hypothetical protein